MGGCVVGVSGCGVGCVVGCEVSITCMGKPVTHVALRMYMVCTDGRKYLSLP